MFTALKHLNLCSPSSIRILGICAKESGGKNSRSTESSKLLVGRLSVAHNNNNLVLTLRPWLSGGNLREIKVFNKGQGQEEEKGGAAKKP